MAKAQSIIGAGVGRVEGAEKVSGQAIYAADVHYDDALMGQDSAQPLSARPHRRHRAKDDGLNGSNRSIGSSRSDCFVGIQTLMENTELKPKLKLYEGKRTFSIQTVTSWKFMILSEWVCERTQVWLRERF